MSVSSEAPSSRALKMLNNRNNVADLYLRKRLEQMEREKNFCMHYLDKDRLDVTYFLKNLHKCDSDDLPQSKLIKEEWDSDDDLTDDEFNNPHVRHHSLRSRHAHTAKTAPPRVGRRHRRRQHHDEDEVEDDDDDDDDDSLDEHHPRREIKTSVPTRRQMLSRRHHEDELAKESKFDKTENFLRTLRQNAAKEHKDAFTYQLTRREFTAFLLSKLRGEESSSNYPGAGGRGGAFWTGPGHQGGDGWRGEDGDDEAWERARKDLVYPIKRLGNIASKFYESGRNSPALLAGGGIGASGGGHKRRSSSKKRAGYGAAAAGGGGGGGGGVDGKDSDPFPKHRSIFEITDDDPPASALPRAAGLPDYTRCNRDTIMDTARAYGFGEAAIVSAPGKNSPPPPQTTSPAVAPPPPVSLFSRANRAEMRRAERQVKANKAPPWHSRASQAPIKDSVLQGTDMLRAILQIKCRFRAKPLDDRVKDFMREIDELTKSRSGKSHPLEVKK